MKLLSYQVYKNSKDFEFETQDELKFEMQIREGKILVTRIEDFVSVEELEEAIDMIKGGVIKIWFTDTKIRFT